MPRALLKELKSREIELESRLNKLEKVTRGLEHRIDELEKKMVVRPPSAGVVRTYKPPKLKKELKKKQKVRKLTKVEKVKKEKPRVKRELLKKEIEDLLKKHVSEVERKPILKEEKKREVKEIMKKEIERVIQRSRVKKEKKSEKILGIGDLKIDLGKDARNLFEILLKKGVVRLDEVAKELQVDEEIVKEWAEDLERGGLIQIDRYPYGPPDLKLKELSVALKYSK